MVSQYNIAESKAQNNTCAFATRSSYAEIQKVPEMRCQLHPRRKGVLRYLRSRDEGCNLRGNHRRRRGWCSAPKCHINYLGEGETICESCAALISEEDKDEAGWEKEEEVLEEGPDEDDILLTDEESLVEDEAWEEETEGEDDIIIDDDLGDEDPDDFADVADEEDEEDFEDEEEDSEDDE